jgi:hypothetical protein
LIRAKLKELTAVMCVLRAWNIFPKSRKGEQPQGRVTMELSVLRDMLRNTEDALSDAKRVDPAFAPFVVDLEVLLQRCRELVVQLAGQEVPTALVSTMTEDVKSFLLLLRRWRTRLGSRFSAASVFQSKPSRLACLRDAVWALRDYRDELSQVRSQRTHTTGAVVCSQACSWHANWAAKQIAQAKQTTALSPMSYSLLLESAPASSATLVSAARTGSFHTYELIGNDEARSLWLASFPGRKEVPWGEFRNTIRRQAFMQSCGECGVDLEGVLTPDALQMSWHAIASSSGSRWSWTGSWRMR